MSFRIVVDSCCDLSQEYIDTGVFEVIPFILQLGEEEIVDDWSMEQKVLLQKIDELPIAARSACPSPEAFRKAYEAPVDDIYVITLSAKLSGSHNSAELGKAIYEEDDPDKNIGVIDSMSAAAGESQLAIMAYEWASEGKSFDEVMSLLNKYRDEQQTYFVLDNLDTFRKNGRLSGVKAAAAATLNVKPIMAGEQGEVVQRGQAVGVKKALAKMVELSLKEMVNPERKRLLIVHCNALERAETVKNHFLKVQEFREVLIFDAGGLSTLYANDGGVIVAV